MTATNLPCCQKRVYMCPLSSSLKMQSCCMSFWLTGSRDFTLAGPHPALISVFFAHFQVEMAVTITTTQTDVAVTLANDRMILLTPTFQQKNVTCTAIFLLSEETIYLCLVVNRFLAVEPLWSRQASSRSVAGLTRRRCSNNAFPLQIKALWELVASSCCMGLDILNENSTPWTSFILNELQIISALSTSWYCFSVVSLQFPSPPPQLIQQYSWPVVSYCLIMYFVEQSFKNETIRLEGGEGEEQDNQMCKERGKQRAFWKGSERIRICMGMKGRGGKPKEMHRKCITSVTIRTHIYI